MESLPEGVEPQSLAYFTSRNIYSAPTGSRENIKMEARGAKTMTMDLPQTSNKPESGVATPQH